MVDREPKKSTCRPDRTLAWRYAYPQTGESGWQAGRPQRIDSTWGTRARRRHTTATRPPCDATGPFTSNWSVPASCWPQRSSAGLAVQDHQANLAHCLGDHVKPPHQRQRRAEKERARMRQPEGVGRPAHVPLELPVANVVGGEAVVGLGAGRIIGASPANEARLEVCPADLQAQILDRKHSLAVAADGAVGCVGPKAEPQGVFQLRGAAGRASSAAGRALCSKGLSTGVSQIRLPVSKSTASRFPAALISTTSSTTNGWSVGKGNAVPLPIALANFCNQGFHQRMDRRPHSPPPAQEAARRPAARRFSPRCRETSPIGRGAQPGAHPADRRVRQASPKRRPPGQTTGHPRRRPERWPSADRFRKRGKRLARLVRHARPQPAGGNGQRQLGLKRIRFGRGVRADAPSVRAPARGRP